MTEIDRSKKIVHTISFLAHAPELHVPSKNDNSNPEVKQVESNSVNKKPKNVHTCISNSPLGSDQEENKDKNCHLKVTDCSKGGNLKRKLTISFRSKERDSTNSGHRRMIMRFSSKHQSVSCQQPTLAPDPKVCPLTPTYLSIY